MAKVVHPARSARAIIVALALALVLLPFASVPARCADLKEGDMVAPAPQVPRANILSQGWIELELPELEYNAANVTDTSLYTVSSADDPDYAAGVHPDLVNHRYWADSAPYNPGLSPDDDDGGKGTDVAHIIIVYRIFLRLPTPIEEGRTYSVAIDPSVVATGPFSVSYDALAPRDAIHVNQVAYLTSGPKVAYLSMWTGQGCIDFGSSATFEVIDEADGGSAWSGSVQLDIAAAEDTWSKSDVYSMDFTSLTSEGTYHLYVPGVGSSYSFEIASRAYNDIGYTIMRGIAMQRDGDHGLDSTSVTHWARPDAHLDDAYDEATIPGPAKDFYSPSDLAAATRVDLVGGHMDAGDRGKYPHNSADVASSLLSTITLFPEQVEGLGESLQVRESGNGIPDMIDEVVIELDWLRKAVMNTSTQGGLPFTLRPNGFGYEGYMPAEGAANRVFYNKSYGPNRSETLFAAGALSMAFNTPLLAKYLPAEKLESYMSAALKAFACFEDNKDNASFWASEEDACWYDPKMPDQTWDDLWEDEMMFAAANLHRATGQSKYLDWINATKPAEFRDWRVWYWSHYGPPLYAYLSIFEDTHADAALRQWAEDGIMNGAETTEVYDWKDYDKTYGAPLPWHAETTVGWYFTGNEMGFPQMLGYGVSGQTKYLDQLAGNWNYLLGTNPLSRSFISGLGDPQRRPRWFVHELSQRKWAEYSNGMGGWSEPPPGIPSPDIQDGCHNWFLDDAWNTPRKNKRFPAIEDYAPLYRYHDSWTTTDEMTIDRMTRSACSLVPLISTDQPAASNITLASPNGGERWSAGSTHEIDWTSSGMVGNVKIEYSKDGFKTARTVSAATANDGSFQWHVPDEPASTCTVRISALDGEPSDSSDAVFAIVGAAPPPAPASTFFFAEGTTRPGFEPYLCIQNPSAKAADVKVTYMLGDGTNSVQSLTVGATSRSTVVVKDFLGSAPDPAHDFSARVECTNGQGIIAERPMYFNYNGVWTGGHDVVGAQAPASTFFFAEGTTRPGFEPYLCIQNPSAKAADVKVTYMLGDGTNSVQSLTVGATSRSTVVVKDFLGSAPDPAHDFSARVECTNGQGIIAERPMYFNYNGVWTGGHDVVGAQAPASTFFFAEGTTRPGFEPYLCIQNPSAKAADVKVTYMLGDGTNSVQSLTVGATSRSTVVVKDFLGSAPDPAHDFSARVECTNGQGIIAERPMYFNYNGVWTGGHDVVGAQAPASTFFFAEGTTRPGFEPYLCIQNPSAKAADVKVTYMLGDGTNSVQSLTVGATSRSTVVVKDFLGSAPDPAHDFSARVECTNGQGIIAERPMYFNYNGVWTGGHDVVGTR